MVNVYMLISKIHLSALPVYDSYQVRFGFCDECPEYIINDEEIYDVPNYSLIYFSVYTKSGGCATHGIITNGTSLCRIC